MYTIDLYMLYDVIGGKVLSTQNYKLCFHVRKLHQNTCILVLSPFSAYFYPPNGDRGLFR